MLDYLAIGIHELASMSERRMERLVNPGSDWVHVLLRYVSFDVKNGVDMCTYLMQVSLLNNQYTSFSSSNKDKRMGRHRKSLLEFKSLSETQDAIVNLPNSNPWF